MSDSGDLLDDVAKKVSQEIVRLKSEVEAASREVEKAEKVDPVALNSEEVSKLETRLRQLVSEVQRTERLYEIGISEAIAKYSKSSDEKLKVLNDSTERLVKSSRTLENYNVGLIALSAVLAVFATLSAVLQTSDYEKLSFGDAFPEAIIAAVIVSVVFMVLFRNSLRQSITERKTNTG